MASASSGIHSMFQTKLSPFFRTTNKTPEPTTPRTKRLHPHIILLTMDIGNTPERPSGRSTGRASGLKMFLETMSFFLPLACFPLANLLFCGFWAGKSSNDLPFPPVVLSLITGGASMLITSAMIGFGFNDAAYLYFSCANFSYITLFLFG